LATEIQKVLGLTAQLIPGSGGAFEVKVDGELIFSKLQCGRFPAPRELVTILKASG